jgi:hypothetical protein
MAKKSKTLKAKREARGEKQAAVASVAAAAAPQVPVPDATVAEPSAKRRVTSKSSEVTTMPNSAPPTRDTTPNSVSLFFGKTATCPAKALVAATAPTTTTKPKAAATACVPAKVKVEVAAVSESQHKKKTPTGLSSDELILAFRKAAELNGLNFDLLLTEALTPSTPRGGTLRTGPSSIADDCDNDDYDEDAADLAVKQRLSVLEALSSGDAAADADLESALAASLKLSTGDSNTPAGTSEPSGAIRDAAGQVVQPPDSDGDMDGDAMDEDEEEEEGEEEETATFEPDPLVAVEPVVPTAAPQAAPTAAAKAAPPVAAAVVLAGHAGQTDNKSAENARMVSACHTGGVKTLIPYGEANSNNAMIDWKAFCRQVRNQAINNDPLF